MVVDSDANRIDRAPSAMANSGNAGICITPLATVKTAQFAGNNGRRSVLTPWWHGRLA